MELIAIIWFSIGYFAFGLLAQVIATRWCVFYSPDDEFETICLVTFWPFALVAWGLKSSVGYLRGP